MKFSNKATQSTPQQNLDQEEGELLSSFEKGEWKPVKNVAQEKARAQKIAATTRSKKQI
jgi:hypothetical protein